MSSVVQESPRDYRTACLRLPAFPLQWLVQGRPEWRGKKVAWLEQLKPDSPLRYLSPEAEAMGLSTGMRYATALGLVPDLLAGSCEMGSLAAADKAIIKELRRFTPSIRRGSGHLANGLYILDAQGLGAAFGGMENWARKLVDSLLKLGWQAQLAVGFTPFACEMATYRLTPRRPVWLFQSRDEEQAQTMRMPLSTFGLSPDQVRRLRRFGVLVLEDFLAFETEEVRRRFGSDLVEFYEKAAEALFAEFSPLPEEEPLWAQFGVPEPMADLQAILEIARRLLDELLPGLIRKEEGVSQLLLWLITEEGERIEQRLLPSYPTVDSGWLGQLLRLRLESYFQRHPLRWGRRIERVVMALVGEPDPEKQGELFTDWSADEEDQAMLPRDREAALSALSRVRAEYGEGCLRRARLLDHSVPGRDFSWVAEKESPAWFKVGDEVAESLLDRRVRRHLSEPLPLSSRDRWKDKVGPYLLDGGWWEPQPFTRHYFYAREGTQTGWLYWDERRACWFAQGWLQ
jgi:protein ImuB